MIKFIVPQKYGFCAGVQNAVKLALDAGKAYCLGKIVHNESVVHSLESNGIVTVDDIEKVPDGSTLLIRAHGAPPSIFERAKQKHLSVIDATCPSVRSIQVKAQKYFDDGYQIVLVGDTKHPEIIGINGWCNNTAVITDGSRKISIVGKDKVLIMFQTTFDASKFEKSLQNISTEGVKTLEIFNTICYTTTDRQNYAHLYTQQSDLAVVVGDSNSSNTKRLFEIAKRNCETIFTDGTDGPNVDLSKYKKICFISGASTPAELMEGVLERMTKNAKETVVVETAVSEEKAMDKNGAMFANAISEIKEGARYKLGQKVKCRVVIVNEDGVFVRLNNWKQEAFIPNEELTIEQSFESVKSSLKANDVIDCAILSIENGKITLSRKAIEERYKDDALIEDIKAGKEFSVVMKRIGKDCLTGKLGSYTVVVHASQIKIGFVKDLEPYIGKTLRLVSSPDKVDETKHVIFASQKSILVAEQKAKEDEFWNNIEVDEIVEGTVLRFAPFGAFVSVRGFDCLAHSSDLAWERINKPEEVLELGKSYEFVVLSLDREKNRVSLGYKQLQPQPWELAAEKFAAGTVVKGKVARILPFGAFVELDKHIDGLLHVSNVSWEWLDDINKALKVGDEVEVQVLEFDGANKRITLSRKALLPRPEGLEEQPAKKEEEQQPAEDAE